MFLLLVLMFSETIASKQTSKSALFTKPVVGQNLCHLDTKRDKELGRRTPSNVTSTVYIQGSKNCTLKERLHFLNENIDQENMDYTEETETKCELNEQI